RLGEARSLRLRGGAAGGEDRDVDPLALGGDVRRLRVLDRQRQASVLHGLPGAAGRGEHADRGVPDRPVGEQGQHHTAHLAGRAAMSPRWPSASTSAAPAFSIVSGRPAYCTVFPALRAEANTRIAECLTARSASRVSITRPTWPVAPTTPMTGPSSASSARPAR